MVMQEAEFETLVVETIHSLKDHDNKYHRKEKLYFAN